MPNSDFSCGQTRFSPGSRHCAVVLFTQVPKKCTDLHLSLLYIFIFGTCSKFASKHHFLTSFSAWRLLAADMLERKPQVCLVKNTFTLLLTNCFVSTTMNSMKCFVNWIPLRIHVCSRNTQPHLKAGASDFSQILTKFQSNPIGCQSCLPIRAHIVLSLISVSSCRAGKNRKNRGEMSCSTVRIGSGSRRVARGGSGPLRLSRAPS